MIYPLPAVMVTCGSCEEEYNIITISWTGTICTNPPMCYISVRPERHSADIIKRNMEFVINLTDASTARATDWCGVRSGKDYDKFKEMGLTPGKATVVQAPIIEESPLCIECRVKEIVPLGSHEMYIAEVVNVIADDKYIDPETKKERSYVVVQQGKRGVSVAKLKSIKKENDPALLEIDYKKYGLEKRTGVDFQRFGKNRMSKKPLSVDDRRVFPEGKPRLRFSSHDTHKVVRHTQKKKPRR